MTREASGQPLGRILVSDLAHDERIEADDSRFRFRQTEIGLGRPGLLVGKGEADQKAIELLAPAIERVDGVIAAQLFDP